MGARTMAKYHPLYSGVWDDPSLEGTSFATKAFFVFLFSNHRVRPSGVYRVSPEQLAADTRLPLAEVKSHLSAILARNRIVVDGEWLFNRGYLKRQPNSTLLLKGAMADLTACRSEKIKRAFYKQYPELTVWLKVGRPSVDGHPTISRSSRDGLVDGYPTVTEQYQSSNSSSNRTEKDRRRLDADNRSRERPPGSPPEELKNLLRMTSPEPDPALAEKKRHALAALAQANGMSHETLEAQVEALVKRRTR